MDNYTATEQAYKNGYEQGKKDAVKHGRWAENERIMYDSVREEEVHLFTYVCSVCNGEVMNNTKYCPNCGARMDGE